MDTLNARAQLRKIQLTAADVGTSIRSRDEAGRVAALVAMEQRVDLDVEAPHQLRVRLEFSVNLVPNGDGGEEDPIVWIRPVFELTYDLPKGVETSDAERSSFAKGTALFNAWPYLREFVQSTLSRMDLPQVSLPLLRRRPAVLEASGESRRAQG